jgi:hypothetical protein
MTTGHLMQKLMMGGGEGGKSSVAYEADFRFRNMCK